MPATILLINAHIATMNDERREIPGGWVRISGNRIEALGEKNDDPGSADEIIDLTGHVLIPGLVNTHHHMFQTLTRAVPAAQDASLFGWLKALYPIWARLTPDMVRVSTRTAMAELLLSGCTTTSDHLYLFPNGSTLDDQIEAADTMGMRFHAARGAMSVGESKGGLPPDSLVEDEASILRDIQKRIERWHDPSRYAMRRVVVAPCSPFSVSTDLMREAAHLARATGTTLHTHLAENDSDVDYSREVFGRTPAEYAGDLGWVGPDVWHAHCVKLDPDGIARFGATRTGIAHCPCSNMRLGSGIAPVQTMQSAGIRVGLGVDGSASNDSSHMLAEARQAMLLARVRTAFESDPQTRQFMTARETLAMATRGGAATLGRDDIGFLAPDMAADLVAFDISGLDHAGAQSDPVAALLFCTPGRTALTMVNGRIVVRQGELLCTDERHLTETHNRLARTLLTG
ncbi:8-oxoguanine deaminase [Acetobacter oeni]|uniref:8-oxoguanine deaminase n=1 Tax=Acetobacter oeni TaxID=304077 RepID=A0A511XQM5_9PROT|nr:8-oxoguanine deaminase [Acetobacter oeni]MBB3881652.1 cytosine/adenosine deaminase-related metal-dependent hydrolase [Acetobacter oeni]NHO17540.1 8-oxoguanine deaminase [Acetobacter oeni]GBR06106.1 hydroxydechloroatrazine ethylaminohydrolase [Acetobacter oeni LMG 21952]GEN65263.1 8-oxoguanine deaminase [Acetobacter oeni]